MSQKVDSAFEVRRLAHGEERVVIGKRILFVLEDGRGIRVTTHKDGGIQISGDDQLAIITNSSNDITIRFAEEQA